MLFAHLRGIHDFIELMLEAVPSDCAAHKVSEHKEILRDDLNEAITWDLVENARYTLKVIVLDVLTSVCAGGLVNTLRQQVQQYLLVAEVAAFLKSDQVIVVTRIQVNVAALDHVEMVVLLAVTQNGLAFNVLAHAHVLEQLGDESGGRLVIMETILEDAVKLFAFKLRGDLL